MAKISLVPLLEPYTFRRDFDYWKYLETKSHFEELSDRMDHSILKVGLSHAELLELASIQSSEQLRSMTCAIKEGQGQIVDELRFGFRDIAGRLDVIADTVNLMRQSVDEVRFAVEAGFHMTKERLTSIENILSDLLKVERTPERTWALEQYATARDLYRREHYRDALEYVDLAINGNESNRGYRFDAQFYLLRGAILLGDRENLDRTLIDARAAKVAFDEAVKHAKPPRDLLDLADAARRSELLQPRCFAYCRSGWASYVLGEIEEAERCYRSAVDDNSDDATANYYLGKVLAHLGRHEEAALFVVNAIKINIYMIAKLALDADFSKDIERYRNEVEQYRKRLLDDLAPLCDALLLASSDKRGFALGVDGRPDDCVINKGSSNAVEYKLSPPLARILTSITDGSAEISAAVRAIPEIKAECVLLEAALTNIEQVAEKKLERL